jgi:hypothetical protein
MDPDDSPASRPAVERADPSQSPAAVPGSASAAPLNRSPQANAVERELDAFTRSLDRRLHESPPTPAVRPAYPGPDRRKQPTQRWSRFALWGGRRRGPRRVEELEGSFVDQYSGRLYSLMIWIGLMNIGDSFFTLLHLQAGGIELNPFAAMLLGTGRTGFVVTKSLLISIPLLVLCLHKNFHLARVGLWVAASCYTLLFCYHLWLL